MYISRRSGAALAALVVGLSVAASVARADTYVHVSTHADAAAQPTAAGRILHTLHGVEGRLYVGYGDYNANTGPINVRYFDPAASGGAGAWSDVLVTGNTEAFHRFRTIGDRVYAPHTDAIGRTLAGYASGPAGGAGAWSDFNQLQNVHLFDMAGHNGQLFIAGSGGPTSDFNSIIYASSDNGASWQVSLDLTTPDPDWDGVDDTTYSFSRFYGIAPLNGRVYAQAVDYYYDQTIDGTSTFLGADTRAVTVFEEGVWSEGPLLRSPEGIRTAFYDPEEVAGRLVVRNGHPGLSGQRMFEFDGEQILEIIQTRTDTGAQALFFDHYVDEQGRLFVLRNDRHVLMTDDLLTWTTIATEVPLVTRSIAVIDDYLYIGATNGELWRTSSPIPEPASVSALALGLLLLLRRRA